MKRTLTNSNFPIFAAQIADPADPADYNESSVKRLMVVLAPYVVDVKGVRFKHTAKNTIELINFSTQEELNAYQQAWDNHVKACVALENRYPGGEGKFLKMVQKNKFVQAAEIIRAPYLAKRAVTTARRENKSLIIGVKHKETIAKIVTIMVKDYGIKRNQIALIWGGLDGGVSKRKAKKRSKEMSLEEKRKLLATFASADDRELLKDMGIDVNELEAEVSGKVLDTPPTKRELTVDEKSLRLGTQNTTTRQEEIDRFQSEVAQYCIFTYKSGGVGLSLQQDEPWKRTREGLFAPVYSGIEAVQALGRAEGFPACSDTRQYMICYDGTVEVDVADKLGKKLKCLREVVRQNQSWQESIYESALHHTYFSGKVAPDKRLIDLGEVELVDEVETEESEDEGE